jgi:hypothetical protein
MFSVLPIAQGFYVACRRSQYVRQCGSVVLRTNNVIPTALKATLDPSLAGMANGMLSPSLFVDGNNSDFDNSYALAKSVLATGPPGSSGD